MMVFVDYASPSVFESTLDLADLRFSTSARRLVRFHGTVRRHGFNLRIALRALGEAIWSNDAWIAADGLLDPIITVHPDRLIFEAFSQDQSTYVALFVDPAIFEVEGEVITGTTNVDFTAWLWGALGEMRTSKHTTFRIGPEGFAIATQGGGGRFERAVEVPDAWVRGFLQVQAAMAMPGTRLDVQPVDLLAAIRYLRYSKAKVAPRALRYEFEPGRDARIVLEPWEHVIPLEGAAHHYQERKATRVWGRRRLKLIESLLPFADSVAIDLKGRALPSFYTVRLAGMTFVLGLSGFSEASFTSAGGFDLLAGMAAADDALLEPALGLLRAHHHRSAREIAQALAIETPAAIRLLTRLCRQGRVMFDLESRRYRHRALLEQPAEELKLFPPDPRRAHAARLLADGLVHVERVAVEETSKIRRFKTPDGPIERKILYRDWRVTGRVAAFPEVQIVVSDSGSILFGRCGCPFFDQNLLQRGPCEHQLALLEASAQARLDQPTSVPASPDEIAMARGGRARDDDEDE